MTPRAAPRRRVLSESGRTLSRNSESPHCSVGGDGFNLVIREVHRSHSAGRRSRGCCARPDKMRDSPPDGVLNSVAGRRYFSFGLSLPRPGTTPRVDVPCVIYDRLNAFRWPGSVFPGNEMR
ncbi:hypothetical protein EVAR_75675_1 [Eumeta japonica]|uniref:Uncharacterized protein n=1 Tax=Eumeta variegata TaxID=151549 RepID=A0A4C1U045_EUMVA|nr:hypothetical protein EVAR_75675_1 [Eumeta japonica]